MLMFKTRALKLGLLTIAVFGVTLAACSDDNDAPQTRTKTYELVATGGAKAFVVATANADSSFNLKFTLSKSTKDTTYFFNVFKGSIGSATNDTLLKLGQFKSTADGSSIFAQVSNIKTLVLPGQTTATKFTYDSLIKYRSYAKITFARGAADSVVAKGNLYQPQ